MDRYSIDAFVTFFGQQVDSVFDMISCLKRSDSEVQKTSEMFKRGHTKRAKHLEKRSLVKPHF